MNESIVVTDLCKDYRNVRALDRVSLTVGRGELFGLLGVNGKDQGNSFGLAAGDRHRAEPDGVGKPPLLRRGLRKDR